MALVTASFATVCDAHVVFFTLLKRPQFPALIGVGRGGPLLVGSVGHLLVKDLFTKCVVSGGVPPAAVPRVAVPCCLGAATLVIAVLNFVLTLRVDGVAGGLGCRCPSGTFGFSALLKCFPAVVRHLTPCVGLSVDRGSTSSLLSLV